MSQMEVETTNIHKHAKGDRWAKEHVGSKNLYKIVGIDIFSTTPIFLSVFLSIIIHRISIINDGWL